MSATQVDLNPQGEQMADESMIRTLAAQIEAFEWGAMGVIGFSVVE
jgi:hypothetical protein